MPITPTTDEALAAVRQGFRQGDPQTQALLLALQKAPQTTEVTGMSPWSRLMGMLVGGALGRTTTPWFGPAQQRIQLNFPLNQELANLSREPELTRTLSHEGGHVAANLAGQGTGRRVSGIPFLDQLMQVFTAPHGRQVDERIADLVSGQSAYAPLQGQPEQRAQQALQQVLQWLRPSQ